jgi:D-methionine transport system permease protein
VAGILGAITVTTIALIGYSAMSGVIGGGGLGDLAVRYGYQRFNTPVMIITVVILVVLVQLIQIIGDRVVTRLSHR